MLARLERQVEHREREHRLEEAAAGLEHRGRNERLRRPWPSRSRPRSGSARRCRPSSARAGGASSRAPRGPASGRRRGRAWRRRCASPSPRRACARLRAAPASCVLVGDLVLRAASRRSSAVAAPPPRQARPRLCRPRSPRSPSTAGFDSASSPAEPSARFLVVQVLARRARPEQTLGAVDRQAGWISSSSRRGARRPPAAADRGAAPAGSSRSG